MLRFFVETMPLAALLDPALLSRAAQAADGLVVAVRPTDRQLDRVVAALRDAGLAVTLWPMLEDAAGRWCTTENSGAFVAFAERVRRDAGLRANDALLLDLEPPWRLLDAVARGRVGQAWAAHRELVSWRSRTIARAERELSEYVTELKAGAIDVHTAELPWALVAPGWARAFGVPHVGAAATRGVMLYTSMIEGYSRRMLGRAGAVRGLRRLGARALTWLGPDAELQLGAVGTGALAHEPVYRAASELAEDLTAVLELGCRRIAVFELGGILRRPDADLWLSTCAAARDVLRRRVPDPFGSIEEAPCDSSVPP